MIEQPVAVISGAGSGIGRATATLLAQKNYRVALVGRRADRLNETAAAIGAANCLVLLADITAADQAERVIAQTHAKFKRLDALINNAGLAPLLSIDKTTPAIIDEVYRVNAMGPAYLIHYAWPIFLTQKQGCIVNISTMGTSDPFQGFFAYAAAKAGVNLMAASCAKEGKRYGIRAFAIAPGAVETEMLRANFPENRIPRSMTMPPEKIAGLILDCIEGRREADNGKVIEVRSP